MGDAELAKKLNLKPGIRVSIVGLPADLALDLGEAVIVDETETGGLLVFVGNQLDLDARREEVVSAALDDRITWVLYPKAGQLGTDLNRDVLWKLLASSGIRPVRQVSIDSTWSALRFRPA